MRFILMMIPPNHGAMPANAMPPVEAVREMVKFNESLRQAGVLLALDGFAPPAAGARVVFDNGKVDVSKGASPNAEEFIGGYWMLKVKSLDEAIGWAKKCPTKMGSIEVRPVNDTEDFSPEIQKVIDEYPELRRAAEKRWQ